MKAPGSIDNVDMGQIAWSGHLPVMRGGVATFTLQATQPFAITLRADPERSAGASLSIVPFSLVACTS